MDITTKVIEIHPFSQISELFINDSPKRLCYILEDIQRPPGHKVAKWTALPRTGLMQHYSVGIRTSPAFGRQMLGIYNQPDKQTVELEGISFTYAMFHGGNNHTNTEGCPLVAYEKISQNAVIDYQGKKIELIENVVYKSAEKELFDMVSKAINYGENIRLFMIGL